MSNEENIAAGVFELRAEAGQFSAVVANGVELAQRFERIVFDSFNKAGKAASDTSAVESSAKRYVSALEREALALERKTVALVSTLAEQRRAEAAGRGQSAEAEAVIAKIDRAEKSYKSLSDTLRQVANINAFGELLTKSEALGQVGKNIDGITAALERLEGEERQLGQTRVFEARVAEAAKLGMAEQYIERYKQAGQNMAAAEKAFAADISFIDSLQRRANAINKTQSELLELEAAQRGLTAQAAPHIAALRAQEKALGIYSAGARDARVQTNQMRTALSQLPMQFTDIFTSLAGGQNPLLVLIQQGGQIKDSFGGIGPALRGMAGAIASAFTPVRVLIGGALAVVGAFTAGVVAGEKEMTAYRVALSLTGNAAGATAGQLQSAAEAVSRVVGTQGKAAEAIAALAATGRVAAADLDKLAEAAIRLEREGGPAVKDTVAAFAELGKAPTAGALKLNESTRFLTVSVLEQIKALEEQGRATEAARLAQRAYADESIARTKQLEQQLGSLEKAARGVTTFFKEMWDAVLDVGRQETPAKRIEGITKALEANARRTDRSDSFGPSGVREGGDAQRSRLLDELKAANRAILNDFERTGKAAANIVDDAYVKAAASVKKWGDESQTSTQKAEKALKEFRREVETVNAKRVADGLQPLSKAEIQKLEQTLIESFNKGNKAIKERDSVLEAARAEAKRWADEIAGFQKIGADATATTEHLTKAEKLLIEALENPAWVTRTAEQQKLTIAEYLAAKAKEDLAASTKAAEKALQDYTKAVIANAAAMASDEAKVEADLQRLRDEYVELTAGKEALEAQAIARLELAAAMKEQAAAQALIDGASDSALVADSLQRQAQALRDQIAQRGLNQGARRNNELAEENRKAAEDAAQEWTRTADSIRDGLTDAFRRAFESGEDFGTAMARVIERELKARVATALSGLLADGVMAILGIQTAGGAAGSARGNTNWMQLAQTGQTLYRYGANAYNWATSGGSAAMYSTGAAGTVGVTGAQGAYLGEGVTSGVAAWDAAAAGSTSASTGAAGASSGSWGAAAGYAALIAAAIVASDKAYDRGFTGSDQLSGKLWYESSIENATRSVLSKLGVNDKWAEILSGSVALNDSFGYSQARVEAAGVQGTLGAGDFTGQSFADIKSKAGWVRKLFGSDDRTSTELSALPAELGNFLDTAAKSVFDQAKEFGEALGLPAEALAGITTDIKVTLTDDIEANKAEIAKALGTYGDALVGAWADAVTPLAAYGETTAQTVQRVGGAIVGVNAVLDTLGIAALQASVDGGKAALALQSLFGGQQGLEQATGSYLQNYYDEAERSNLALAGIGKTLGEVGLTVPKTKEEFRALVEAQNLMQPAGQAAFAALMKVEGAFASVTASSDAASAALQDAIAAALPKFGRGAGPYGQIQQDLSTAGVSVSVDYLKGLNTKDAIYAAADAFARFSDASDAAKTAVVKAASALADLRDEADAAATDLQIELLRAQGDELGAVTLERERELAALRELDPALASVNQLIYDAIDAAAEAARVSDLLGNLDGVIADFLSGSDLASYWATRVQQALAAGGIDADLGGILGSTTADIRQLWDAVGIDGKEAILDAYGAWQAMDEVLHGTARTMRANITEYRGGTLADSIAQARLDALAPHQQVAFLRSREAQLFGQIDTAADPVSVAEDLQAVIIQRLQIESGLRTDLHDAERTALDRQIDGMRRLADMAGDIRQFVGEIAFGDLSPLNAVDQLDAARGLFDATLQGAQSGDADALGRLLGNAEAYLQEAAAAYASGPQYAAIYSRVMADLEGMGVAATQAESQIDILTDQRDALTDLSGTSTSMLDALLRIDTALSDRLGNLGGIDTAPGADFGTGAEPGGTQTVTVAQPDVVVPGAGAVRTDATLIEISARIGAVATHTAQLATVVSNQGAQLALDREGYSQVIARLAAIEAVQADILREMRVGAVPVD